MKEFVGKDSSVEVCLYDVEWCYKELRGSYGVGLLKAITKGLINFIKGSISNFKLGREGEF